MINAEYQIYKIINTNEIYLNILETGLELPAAINSMSLTSKNSRKFISRACQIKAKQILACESLKNCNLSYRISNSPTCQQNCQTIFNDCLVGSDVLQPDWSANFQHTKNLDFQSLNRHFEDLKTHLNNFSSEIQNEFSKGRESGKQMAKEIATKCRLEVAIQVNSKSGRKRRENSNPKALKEASEFYQNYLKPQMKSRSMTELDYNYLATPESLRNSSTNDDDLFYPALDDYDANFDEF